jgi:hypothetical protein
MKLTRAGTLLLFAIVLPIATVAGASRQGSSVRPPPSREVAGAIFPGQCSAHDQKHVQLQIEALKRLRDLTRNEGEKLCAAIDAADRLPIDRLLDPKALQPLLTPHQRDVLLALGIDLAKVDVAKLLRLLGVDPHPLDLRQLRDHCRRSQDGLERFASDELARLEAEIMRCDERV